MSLFLSGFLLKGLQRLASRLLDCLFAADTKGINYLAHKNIAFAFLHCAGLKINHVTYPLTRLFGSADVSIIIKRQKTGNFNSPLGLSSPNLPLLL